MVVSRRAFLLAVSTLQFLAAAWALPAQSIIEDPDRLYADRANLASAQRAAALWEARLASEPHDFEAAWKLARACYWLGSHVDKNAMRAEYERGIQAGKRAAGIEAQRPEGHFWLAANMSALAEFFGLRQGLKYRGAIKDELETVLRLDASFQQGAADRALGRWYLKVPALFGGSKTRSVERLQRSLTYNPDSIASHYFLAETFLAMNRRADARAELQKVLDAPLDPDWSPEDREFKTKAEGLLERRK